MARACDACKGSGFAKCSACDGSNDECETCYGQGTDRNTVCPVCNGTRLWTLPNPFEHDGSESEEESAEQY